MTQKYNVRYIELCVPKYYVWHNINIAVQCIYRGFNRKRATYSILIAWASEGDSEEEERLSWIFTIL